MQFESKPQIPTLLVVFGATGDLMQRKIIPSLFYLHKQKMLPDKFRALGFAKGKYSDTTFRNYVYHVLKSKKLVRQKSQANAFLKMFHYQQGNFETHRDFLVLKDHLEEVEGEWKVCANKLFYLAVPPKLIGTIVKNLKRSKLSDPCGGDAGWSRLLVEKPIGFDGESARKLESILSVFKQSQIYRIDHYLGKELVQGILNFRFTNSLFESGWSNKHIERIEIKLFEDMGVEDRGVFYDGVGALRDVGQNHLFEIVALLTMDMPLSNSADDMRQAREKILGKIMRPTNKDVRQKSFRAQYTGYKKIMGVKPGSNTETYFKLHTGIDSPRWRGVPISIESGKRLGRVEKKIVVTYKRPDPCLCMPGSHVNDKVIFTLHSTQGIKIEFWNKKLGMKPEIEKRSFDFLLYKKKQKLQYTEEYAKLLLDCIGGDQTWFVSKKEVNQLWSITDPYVKGWKKGLVPMHAYEPGKKNITKLATATLENFRMAIQKNIGIVGLGKMGGGIALQLLAKNWKVVGFNKDEKETKKLESNGLDGAKDLEEMVSKIPSPRLIWLMIPSGKPVDDTLFGKKGLIRLLEKGDTVIDGGNSYFRNTKRRFKKLGKAGINYIDCGVSGGPKGARYGASLMIGGKKKLFEQYEPLFQDIALPNGYQFFEGPGAGHFVKMVHNGIEYGMMQAIAEGFDLMKHGKFDLNLSKIADVYNNGSVIESRLIAWLYDAFELYGEDLSKINPKVHHSGEGEWTVKTAHERGIRDKVIHAALNYRLFSQKEPGYAGRLVSAMRGQFGGHLVIDD